MLLPSAALKMKWVILIHNLKLLINFFLLLPFNVIIRIKSLHHFISQIHFYLLSLIPLRFYILSIHLFFFWNFLLKKLKLLERKMMRKICTGDADDDDFIIIFRLKVLYSCERLHTLETYFSFSYKCSRAAIGDCHILDSYMK